MNAPESLKRRLKTAYRPAPSSIRPVYTGGPVCITQDGRWMITTLGEGAVVSEVHTGRRVGAVRGDGTPITAMTISYPDNEEPPLLITAHQSLAIRFYPLVCIEVADTSSGPAASSSSSGPSPPLVTYTRQISRAHPSPILLLAATPPALSGSGSSSARLFASGAADGGVKVWDAVGGYVTHALRGHGGPVSALAFHVGPSSLTTSGGSALHLLTGCADAKVRIFDLLDPAHRSSSGGGAAGRAAHTLDGHVSAVRGVSVSQDGQWMISGGRDRVVLVWDLSGAGSAAAAAEKAGKSKSKKGKAEPRVVQTLLANETLESAGLLRREEQGERLVAWTAGERGVIRLWDVLKAQEVGRCGEELDEEEEEDLGEDEREQRGVVDVLQTANNQLVAVHHDQNILVYSLEAGPSAPTLERQIIGFNDEVIDALYLSGDGGDADAHLALATNSAALRVYDRAGDARLVRGHADVVLCLARSSPTPGGSQSLVSGSKDNTARVWTRGAAGWTTRAVCEGHAESIGAVAMSRKPGSSLLFTASQDRTVKMWDLAPVAADAASADVYRPSSLATLRIHEKDINALDVAPNDALLASGSQDKLVKIFAVPHTPTKGKTPASGSIRLLGQCKGHKRGVWSVKFSPVDRVVASGAADRTIRLWSLDDFTCLKTFEGHTNSVLRVDFLSAGMQLVSSASDGLVKLWNIREEACVRTLDGHEDKVWALSVSADESRIVSGGADGVVTIWEDCTAAEEAEETAKRERVVALEQDYTNYLNIGDYRKAIQLALAMDQPGRLYALFSAVHNGRTEGDESATNTTITGNASVDAVIRSLGPVDLVRLLKCVRDWNVRAKTSGVAQVVLHAVVRLRSAEDIRAAFDKVAKGDAAAAAAAQVAADALSDEEVPAADAKPRPRRKETPGLKDILEGLIPYTDRHAARLDRLIVDSYMLDYVVGEMDGGIIGGEVMEVEA